MDTFDYKCDYNGCGFNSTGWVTKALSAERGKQHQKEHKTGEAMPELAELPNQKVAE